MSFHPSILIRLSLVLVAFCPAVFAQSFLAELKSEHDPVRRFELAMSFAEGSFESARDFYKKGVPQKGDQELENMTSALNYSVESLAVVNKAKFYKKAEMRVAMMQRRLGDLTIDLDSSLRGWAEQTGRRVEEIHDKLLAGVMRK